VKNKVDKKYQLGHNIIIILKTNLSKYNSKVNVTRGKISPNTKMDTIEDGTFKWYNTDDKCQLGYRQEQY